MDRGGAAAPPLPQRRVCREAPPGRDAARDGASRDERVPPARVKKRRARPATPDGEPFAVGCTSTLLDPLPVSPAGNRSRQQDGERAGNVHLCTRWKASLLV